MDTISPGLPEAMAPRVEFRWPRLSRTWWAGISLTLLFGAVFVWRLSICLSSVLACSR